MFFIIVNSDVTPVKTGLVTSQEVRAQPLCVAEMFDLWSVILSLNCEAEINGIFANKGSSGVERSHAGPHLAGHSVGQK